MGFDELNKMIEDGWEYMSPPIYTLSKDYLDIPLVKNDLRLDFNKENKTFILSNLKNFKILLQGQYK